MHVAGYVAIAGAALGAGGVLAAHHPLAPWVALLAFVAWCVTAGCVRGLWLPVLPAVLPALSFAPWTGWVLFDEFDLAVLGAIAGTHARAATARRSMADTVAPLPSWARAVLAACAAAAAVAAIRGWRAGTAPAFDGFDGYGSALNALRVTKSLGYALLLLPALRAELAASPADAMRRLAFGMQAGLLVVIVAAIGERMAYPGAFAFATDYRTVALFWEMHVGGAAIDDYLAIGVPFVVAAVLDAPAPGRWAVAAVLALLAEYVCLTTYSRGVYVAVAFGIAVVCGLSRPLSRLPAWRRRACAALAVLAVVEVGLVLGIDSFMLGRVRQSAADLVGRMVHWRHGLSLAHGPLEWSFGLGAGRLPSAYAHAVPEHGFSGDARLVGEGGRGPVRLLGPQRDPRRGGLYALTQRVTLSGNAGYSVALAARVAAPTRLSVRLCRMHLLYEDTCARATVALVPGSPQPVTVALRGSLGSAPAAGAVFAVAVDDAGAAADIDEIRLLDEGGRGLLRNGDFSAGLARWFPVATRYFVPWHIDSLWLELLVEQGVAGLAASVLLFGGTLRELLSPRNQGLPWRAVLVASVSSALLIGLVSSLLDVPRVAMLLYLLVLSSLSLCAMPVALRRP